MTNDSEEKYLDISYPFIKENIDTPNKYLERMKVIYIQKTFFALKVDPSVLNSASKKALFLTYVCRNTNFYFLIFRKMTP